MMRSLLEELRHRNVFRVGVAYVIAGWLFVQVADIATESFAAPEWVMRIVIIFLLVGLPVALFLAWAFELTPDGVVKAEDVPEDAPKDPRAGKRLNAIIMVALVVAVAWLGWDRLQKPMAPTQSVVVDKSIAVLPFDDFSPDGDQAWFADGLTEEILNSLARTSDLQVASRTSSFAYRDTGENLSSIAAALGVAHILEGSVRRAGKQLRVTAQLIRASDDKHLWSETFDGDVDNSIAIQEDIAIEIANALETAMDPDELARMIAAGTRSVEAWETYLHARALEQHALDIDKPGLIFEVIALFDKAVAIDPGFVDAYQASARLWYFQLEISSTDYSPVGPPYAVRRDRFDAALAAAIKHARSEADRVGAEAMKAQVNVQLNDLITLTERLLVLAPENFDALNTLIEAYQQQGELEKAREMALRAWDVRQRNSQATVDIIYNMRRLDMATTMQMVETGLKDPAIPPVFYYQAQRALLDAGDLGRAREMMDLYLLRSTDADGTLIVQMRQACAEGRTADADALYEQLDDDSNTHWLFLQTLGHKEDARELLRQYDTPDKLFILAEFLDYRTFDPRHFPLLWKTMQSQGIKRLPPRPQTFECKR
jgi:TolB-like protein